MFSVGIDVTSRVGASGGMCLQRLSGSRFTIGGQPILMKRNAKFLRTPMKALAVRRASRYC